MNSLGAKVPSVNTDNLLKPGFRAGIVLDHFINNKLSYQYGVFYNAKGGFISYDRMFEKEGSTVKQEFDGYLRVDYLEVPVSLLYRSPYRNGGHFFAGGGVYFAGAFGGIISYENYETYPNNQQSGSSVLLPFSTGSDAEDDVVKILDIGLQAQAGYELGAGFFTRVYGAYGY